MVVKAEEEHGEGVALWLVEDGEEVGSAHEREGGCVADYADEVDEGGHDAAEDDDQYCEVLVHTSEQPVKGQREEDQDEGAGEIADDAEAQEPLLRRHVPTGRDF